MIRRTLLGVLAALAVTGWSGASRAQATEANGLGSKGQLILTADRLFPLFSYSSVSTTSTQGNTTRTESTRGTSLVMLIGTEPEVGVMHTIPRVGVDFTVTDRLTIGGSIMLAFGLSGTRKTEVVSGPTTTTREVDAPSRTIFGIGPRIGYILPIGDVLGLWLRGGFSFYSDRTKQTSINQGNNNDTVTTSTATAFSVDLDPQLAIVPIRHVFFHVGPIVNIPLTGSQKVETTSGATTVSVSNDISIFHLGVSTGLGGWFDL